MKIATREPRRKPFIFPTPASLEEGQYNYLLHGGQCSEYWLGRFGLRIKDGELIPSPGLKRLWEKEGFIKKPWWKFWVILIAIVFSCNTAYAIGGPDREARRECVVKHITLGDMMLKWADGMADTSIKNPQAYRDMEHFARNAEAHYRRAELCVKSWVPAK